VPIATRLALKDTGEVDLNALAETLDALPSTVVPLRQQPVALTPDSYVERPPGFHSLTRLQRLSSRRSA
jgi:hypothetical protein